MNLSSRQRRAAEHSYPDRFQIRICIENDFLKRTTLIECAVLYSSGAWWNCDAFDFRATGRIISYHIQFTDFTKSDICQPTAVLECICVDYLDKRWNHCLFHVSLCEEGDVEDFRG